MASPLPQGLSDPLGKGNLLPLRRENPSTANSDIWQEGSLPRMAPASYAGKRSKPHESMENTPISILRKNDQKSDKNDLQSTPPPINVLPLLVS